MAQRAAPSRASTAPGLPTSVPAGSRGPWSLPLVAPSWRQARRPPPPRRRRPGQGLGSGLGLGLGSGVKGPGLGFGLEGGVDDLGRAVRGGRFDVVTLDRRGQGHLVRVGVRVRGLG
eukprot:scaffold46969_cov48-Phaeocystis_antarctica.AAC.3